MVHICRLQSNFCPSVKLIAAQSATLAWLAVTVSGASPSALAKRFHLALMGWTASRTARRSCSFVEGFDNCGEHHQVMAQLSPSMTSDTLRKEKITIIRCSTYFPVQKYLLTLLISLSSSNGTTKHICFLRISERARLMKFWRVCFQLQWNH